MVPGFIQSLIHQPHWLKVLSYHLLLWLMSPSLGEKLIASQETLTVGCQKVPCFYLVLLLIIV